MRYTPNDEPTVSLLMVLIVFCSCTFESSTSGVILSVLSRLSAQGGCHRECLFRFFSFSLDVVPAAARHRDLKELKLRNP